MSVHCLQQRSAHLSSEKQFQLRRKKCIHRRQTTLRVHNQQDKVSRYMESIALNLRGMLRLHGLRLSRRYASQLSARFLHMCANTLLPSSMMTLCNQLGTLCLCSAMFPPVGQGLEDHQIAEQLLEYALATSIHCHTLGHMLSNSPTQPTSRQQGTPALCKPTVPQMDLRIELHRQLMQRAQPLRVSADQCRIHANLQSGKATIPPTATMRSPLGTHPLHKKYNEPFLGDMQRRRKQAESRYYESDVGHPLHMWSCNHRHLSNPQEHNQWRMGPCCKASHGSSQTGILRLHGSHPLRSIEPHVVSRHHKPDCNLTAPAIQKPCNQQNNPLSCKTAFQRPCRHTSRPRAAPSPFHTCFAHAYPRHTPHRK